MSTQQNGFQNNFGHSIGGLGYRGVEGVLIANILKPFVTKCVENTRELYGSDNIVCRRLKFRTVLLSFKFRPILYCVAIVLKPYETI